MRLVVGGNKKFQRSNDLKRHVLLHAGKHSFPSEACYKKFARDTPMNIFSFVLFVTRSLHIHYNVAMTFILNNNNNNNVA